MPLCKRQLFLALLSDSFEDSLTAHEAFSSFYSPVLLEELDYEEAGFLSKALADLYPLKSYSNLETEEFLKHFASSLCCLALLPSHCI